MSEWQETEIYPRVPADWQEHTLDEFGHFKNGLNFNRAAFGPGIPIINVKQLHSGRYASLDDLEELLPEKISNTQDYKLETGDILFARSSVKLEGTGQVAMVNQLPSNVTCFSGFIIRYRIHDECLNPYFLNYLLRSNQYREFFISIATGTSIFNLSQQILKDVPVYFPLLEEQEAITAVLASLDDKIDLLHCQNKTLEALAQTLFRHWFIDGAEDDWEDGTLDDALTAVGGTTPSTKNPDFWDGDIHWTTPRDLSNNDGPYLLDTARRITKSGLAKISSGLLPKGTLLLSSRAPVGYLGFSEVPIAINQGYIAILDNKGLSKHFIYLWLKENMDYVKSYAGGTTFMEISKSSFRSLEITIPPVNLREAFEEIISPLFEKIRTNTHQIRTLENLRDTLLPKLMSGEVRVRL